MRRIHVLTNSIQTYAWGSHTAIADLLGHPVPSEKPQAELWMGAHPKAPSMVDVEQASHSLLEALQRAPVDILGSRVAAAYDNRLPYLFKVLAAEEPLSIQAHPNAAQAVSGYDKENELNIPLDAPHRNYKDGRHKPECICALTPFWGLCGFRTVTEILALVERICPHTLKPVLQRLKIQPEASGLKNFFESLMKMDAKSVGQVVQEATVHARVRQGQDPVSDWIIKLGKAYPGDIGVIFPAVLNLVCLQPGEALFLPAGELHAYLHGVGIEVMANSDNVLRGGLTPKHVDLPELMNVLTFQERGIEILRPELQRPFETCYRTPAKEFVLSVITLEPGQVYESPGARSAEILLMVKGEGTVLDGSSGERVDLVRGMSVIVPAALPGYRIQGRCVVYKAGVPLEKQS